MAVMVAIFLPVTLVAWPAERLEPSIATVAVVVAETVADTWIAMPIAAFTFVMA